MTLPPNLNSFLGNARVVEILRRAVELDRLPHALIIHSALSAYALDPAERVIVSTAFLGYCIAEAPRRFPSEDWTQYGQRIYDWLLKEGADSWEIIRAASASAEARSRARA